MFQRSSFSAKLATSQREVPTHTPAQPGKARFGAFEIDLRTGELRKHGLKIKLQDQPFQVLRLLLERSGEIVTREELRSKLWLDNTFVDFDVGLNTAIKRLREALGDSADSSHYVETLPRKGYRFIAAVEPIEDAAPVPVPEIGKPQPIPPSRRVRRYWAGAISVAVLLLLTNIGSLRQRLHPAPLSIQSIAVLPLENLSGDTAQEYFVDGMTDALTTDLGKIGKLRVVSKTSMMRYKGTKKSLQEIGRELDVDALVEGSVSRSGDRVRINANLVQVSPEKHLWADSFESNIRNVLDLQDDASRAIASAIQVRLTPQEQDRLTKGHSIDPRAYDSYLQGRFFAEKDLPGSDGKQPMEYFRAAIKQDPGWALPYAGLADIYLLHGINSAIPNESCEKARDTVLEALKRDSESAEAHTTLADIEYFCEWNWTGAEQEINRAIETDPNFARAHSARGRYLLTLGRTDEMLEETRRAVELDPLTFRVRWNRWIALYLTGRYDEALEQCRKIQEIDPKQNLGYVYCGAVYVQKGNLEKAVQEAEESVNLAPNNPRAAAYLGYTYAVAGRRKDAQKQLADLMKMSKERHVHPYLIALVYAGLGQDHAALDWLETAYDVRSRDLLEIKYEPRFARFRTNARFIDLIRRIGFPS